jgi:hypothetical protein
MSFETESAQRYRRRASALRIIADQCMAQTRRTLMQMADDYEQMAASMEALDSSSHSQGTSRDSGVREPNRAAWCERSEGFRGKITFEVSIASMVRTYRFSDGDNRFQIDGYSIRGPEKVDGALLVAFPLELSSSDNSRAGSRGRTAVLRKQGYFSQHAAEMIETVRAVARGSKIQLDNYEPHYGTVSPQGAAIVIFCSSSEQS